MNQTVSESHRKELKSAMLLLENPGIAAKITNLVGTPIEKGLKMLPEKWNEKIGEVTKSALLKASNAAIFTLKDNPGEETSTIWHLLSAAATGGIAGFFGLPALIIELPISTTIMLRSIAEIARYNGESINTYETKLACLEVFAMGGKNNSDDSTESGYYIIRAALAKSVSEAAEFVVTKTLIEEGAPALIRLLVTISERYAIQITEKAAAQGIPLIGAAGGALINTIFMDHFQDMAKGHFTVRKLERVYGKEAIKKLFIEMKNDGKK